MEKKKEIPSWEELREMFALSKKESDERWIKKEKEEAKRREEEAKREAKRREEEAVRAARIDALLEKTLKGISELEVKTDDINGEVKGIGESNGKFSETYFYNSLLNSMKFGGKNFDEMDKGLKRAKKLPDGSRLKGEYDVIMYNGDTIALIEVKYKVQKEHIEKLRTKQLSIFKEFFPQYKNHNFYLGIAGLSFEDGTQDLAKDYGIGILRPKGESVEILDKKLKVY